MALGPLFTLYMLFFLGLYEIRVWITVKKKIPKIYFWYPKLDI